MFISGALLAPDKANAPDKGGKTYQNPTPIEKAEAMLAPVPLSKGPEAAINGYRAYRTWRFARNLDEITPQTIERIERHLNRLKLTEEENAPNAAMIQRLRNGERTKADRNFHEHELTESEFMDAGMNPRESHLETLKRQGIEYAPGYESELYHPDVVKQFSDHFNPAVLNKVTGQ